MFGALKKNKEIPVYAPMNGVATALSDVPDEAFAEKMLGDGAAVLPDGGEVLSPVDGVVADVTDTKHAFCITTDDGTDLLLHIGVNTVNLKGEGFSVFVSDGDHVKAGAEIAQVDLELLKKHGLPLETPVLLTEPEKTEVVKTNSGTMHAGKDVLFTYKKI